MKTGTFRLIYSFGYNEKLSEYNVCEFDKQRVTKHLYGTMCVCGFEMWNAVKSDFPLTSSKWKRTTLWQNGILCLLEANVFCVTYEFAHFTHVIFQFHFDIFVCFDEKIFAKRCYHHTRLISIWCIFPSVLICFQSCKVEKIWTTWVSVCSNVWRIRSTFFLSRS